MPEITNNEFIRIVYQQQYVLMKAREFAVRAQIAAEPTLPLLREEARKLIETIEQCLIEKEHHL